MPEPCKFCGQFVMNADTEDEAINLCTCIDSRVYRALQEQKFIAKSNIERLCMSETTQSQIPVIDDSNLVEFFEQAVDFIGDRKIDDVTIKLSHGGKIKIAFVSGGTITVKRTVIHSEELKANKK